MDFNKWAKDYDYETEIYGYSVERLLKHLHINLRKGFNYCLDIGCGTGKSMEFLKKYCKNIIGIDSSIEMVKIARRKGFLAYLQKAENFNINFKFDLISLIASIDFMNTRKVIEVVKKHMHENSYLVLTWEEENDIEDLISKKFEILSLKLKRAYENQRYYIAFAKFSKG